MELTTELIGINGFCTYWGYGNSEYTLHEDMIKEDFENGDSDIHPDYYFTYFDNDKYMKVWNNRVQAYLSEYIIDTLNYTLGASDWEYIEEGYYSPKFYNYGGDKNLFSLNGDWELIFNYCRNNEKFEKYLKDNFSSRDGFISFGANNIPDWEKAVLDCDSIAYGAALGFILHTEGEGINAYDAFEDLFYSEFVDCTALDEFLKSPDFSDMNEWQKALVDRGDVNIFENVKSLIAYAYGAGKSEEEICKDMEEVFDYDLSNLVQNYIKQTADQTLKLDL